jgi:aspartokinase/homoserine dehydrogenase 1
MELSHFGAKVIYPPSVHPARSRGIPLAIRNTLDPAAAGTVVTKSASAHPHDVRGITSIHRVALLRLEGDGMVGVPGIAMRLFGALAAESISVILITQASSEHSICFALAPDAVERARSRIRREFALERGAGLVDELVVEEELSVVAAVGEAMRERPGIAGRLFGVLGARGISVRAIAQGSSELNISCIVAAEDEGNALKAIHGAFFDENEGSPRAGRVYVAGPGRVGGAMIAQLAGASRAAAPGEAPAPGSAPRLCGVARRGRHLHDPAGIDAELWRSRLEADGRPGETVDFVRHVLEDAGAGAVFVDCTADDELPTHYEALLRAGVAVVAANKRAFAGPGADRARLAGAAASGGAPLLYETTVGAGLPVLRTCADLVATGDRVLGIDAVLSGSIAAILAGVRDGRPFGAVVREAHASGLTEPDPRDDLSGTDVARKLVILAREAGWTLELEEVTAEPLLPGTEWAALSQEEFLASLERLDAVYAEGSRRAEETGSRLCYLASVRPESGGRASARVAISALPADHPCASGQGTDNVVCFSTQRYGEAGLVIRGPGAGPEVTAAGVLADVLRAIRLTRGRPPG